MQIIVIIISEQAAAELRSSETVYFQRNDRPTNLTAKEKVNQLQISNHRKEAEEEGEGRKQKKSFNINKTHNTHTSTDNNTRWWLSILICTRLISHRFFCSHFFPSFTAQRAPFEATSGDQHFLSIH